MANVNAPHGFIPVRTLDGSCITAARYTLSSSNGSIGIGDLLIIDTNGVVTGRSAASPASGTVVGVAAEAKAANTGGTILVYDNPSIVFEGQTDDGTGTATVQTAAGANINIVNTAPSNGISQQELDENTANVTSTLPFKMLRLYPVVGNSLGEFNRWEVVLNRVVSLGGGDGATGI